MRRAPLVLILLLGLWGPALARGLPRLNARGYLPAGIHHADFSEIEGRFATTPRRAQLIRSLHGVALAFRAAGIRNLWLAGSLPTAKAKPGDIDLLYRGRRGIRADRQALTNAMRGAGPLGIHVYHADQGVKVTGVSYPPEKVASFMRFFRSDRQQVPRGIVKIRMGSL
jgi:hypothetical protein